MGNQNALSHGDLTSALSALGRESECRRILLQAIRAMESIYLRKDVNVRESVTGPIIDAMFRPEELLQKELENGIIVNFRYTSKIARDFVMAGDHPDHVWEPQTTRLLVALARRAKNAIVGGAYFGDQALLIAQAMRPAGGKCYCFEINQTQLEVLRTNVALNQMDNLIPVAKGLWSKDGVRLALVGDDSHAAPQETDDREEGFEAITIDAFGARMAMDELGLLMLDIEGGELAALKGAHHYLSQSDGRAPNVVFEVHRSYVDWSDGLASTEIARYLEGLGFSQYAIRDYQGNVDMRGRPVEIVPIRNAYLAGPPHGFNVLATKDARLIEEIGLHVVNDVSPKLLFHRDPKLHQPLS
jgi:FkbM family methyltransferase